MIQPSPLLHCRKVERRADFSLTSLPLTFIFPPPHPHFPRRAMSKTKNEVVHDMPVSDESATNSPAGSTLATSMSTTSSNQGDEAHALTYCKWKGCTSAYEDPEDLYVHLCNDHVGRKSTNNLCLTCQWKDCEITCAKRDHITSHLRGE